VGSVLPANILVQSRDPLSRTYMQSPWSPSLMIMLPATPFTSSIASTTMLNSFYSKAVNINA